MHQSEEAKSLPKAAPLISQTRPAPWLFEVVTEVVMCEAVGRRTPQIQRLNSIRK